MTAGVGLRTGASKAGQSEAEVQGSLSTTSALGQSMKVVTLNVSVYGSGHVQDGQKLPPVPGYAGPILPDGCTPVFATQGLNFVKRELLLYEGNGCLQW